MSVNPSARSSSPATYCGARQVVGDFSRVIVVTSGGGSAANDLAPPPSRAPASPPRPATHRVGSGNGAGFAPLALRPPRIGSVSPLAHSARAQPSKEAPALLKSELMGRKSDFQQCRPRSSVRCTAVHRRRQQRHRGARTPDVATGSHRADKDNRKPKGRTPPLQPQRIMSKSARSGGVVQFD